MTENERKQIVEEALQRGDYDRLDDFPLSPEEFDRYMDGLIRDTKTRKKKPAWDIEDKTLDIHKRRILGGYKVKEEREWVKQRVSQGFCDPDLWEINRWFCLIIPKMLRTLKERNKGIPQELIDQEYLENREKYPLIKDVSELSVSGDDQAKEDMKSAISDIAFVRWNEILTDMAERFDRVYALWDEIGCPAEKLQEATENAFSPFVKWFNHLWW